LATLSGVQVWAAYHFRAACKDLARHHTDDAIAHLARALTIWPRDPQILRAAAQAARRSGAYDEAQHFLDRYREVGGPDDDDAVLEQVLLRVEQGDIDRMSRFCQDLVHQAHPAAGQILETCTRGYARMFRLQEAEGCLQRLFEREPDSAEAYFLQAQIYDQQGRQVDSLESYRKTLQLDAERDDARLRLAALLVNLHQAAEAAPHLAYLQKRKPYLTQAWLLSARCADQLGLPDEAERLLGESLARNPDFAPALAERGKLALQREDPVAAESWFRQALAREPGDYETRYQLLLTLERNHKTSEAEAEQRRLERIQDDMRRIQEIATHFMQSQPHDAALHYEAGMIAMRAGSLQEGLRWLQSAVKEDPQYAPAHKALAEFYEQTGSPARASRHRRLAEAAADAATPAAAAAGAAEAVGAAR
jgi:Tfp pilus assembly protein PilF